MTYWHIQIDLVKPDSADYLKYKGQQIIEQVTMKPAFNF